MRVLVSVRDAAEARRAAAAGVDLVDCKEPGAGALGALPVATIAEIVAALREAGFAGATSATIGDLDGAPADTAGGRRVAASAACRFGREAPMPRRLGDAATPRQVDDALARVEALAAAGVDYVKVGVEAGPAAVPLLRALAGCGRAVVPVFVADRGLDDALVARARGLGFPAVMADTADKRAGSLFELLPAAALSRFVAAARAAGVPVGLAGALRRADLPRLRALAPDFAGFRSAVCDGDRAGTLDAGRLRALLDAVRETRCAGSLLRATADLGAGGDAEAAREPG